MVVGVEDREEDKARRPSNREKDGDHREDLLSRRGVGGKTTSVTKVPLREEGKIKEDGGDYATGDE